MDNKQFPERDEEEIIPEELTFFPADEESSQAVIANAQPTERAEASRIEVIFFVFIIISPLSLSHLQFAALRLRF